MTYVKTYLTILVELAEELDSGEREALAERYFAAVNRAMLQVPEVQTTYLREVEMSLPNEEAPGIALRACPFCGKIFTVRMEECTLEPCEGAECEYCSEGHAWRVLCDPDRGGCGVSTCWSDDMEDAACDWNRRDE